MKKLVSYISFTLLTFVVSCIDPIEVNIDRELNVLIVEGAITTQPGPHFISLKRSAKYGNIFEGFVRPVSSAEVIIRDSDGNNVYLTENVTADGYKTGVYATPNNFRAELGKSYTLLISTPFGVDYSSIPQLVVPAAPIDTLLPVFTKRLVAENTYSSGLNVYAVFKDNPEERNFYLWKNNGTYRILTYPENFMARDGEGNPIPAPKDCCKDCWVDEVTDNSIRLLADNNVNGNTVTDLAAFIEDDGVRFTEKYLIRVEQHTLSREAFEFFNLLKEQMSINGDIFDPPPATLRGNMINLNKPDEPVIGFFRVSDVSVDSLFLTPEMLDEPKPLRQIDDDCRLYKQGSTEQPSYW